MIEYLSVREVFFMLITPLCILKLKQIISQDLSVKDYRNILLPYDKFMRKYNICLIFTSYLWSNIKSPNATAINNNFVMVNPYWIKEIVSCSNNILLQDVFYQTLGHEISHTLYRLPPEIYEIRHSREIKNHTGNFVAWINELYADFNSIKIIFDGNRSKGIECFCYKMEQFPIDKTLGTKSHPSLKRRLYYIQNYDFTEALIRDIATYLQYPTNSEISQVVSYFPEIILH